MPMLPFPYAFLLGKLQLGKSEVWSEWEITGLGDQQIVSQYFASQNSISHLESNSFFTAMYATKTTPEQERAETANEVS